MYHTDIMRNINSFAINRMSNERDLYYQVKQLNPNFSICMEYHNYLLDSRKEKYVADKEVEEIYERLRDVHYSMIYVDEDALVEIYTDDTDIFKDIFGDDFDIEHKTLKAIYDSLAFRFYMYVRYNERGYIIRECLDNLLVFYLNVPEGYYFEEYNERQIEAIREEGLDLYDIAIKQERYYILTKNIPNDLREYCDINRRSIIHVIYDEIMEKIFITLSDVRSPYEINGSIELFMSIVAYLNHPGNIIYENKIKDDQPLLIVNRYYTLDNLIM